MLFLQASTCVDFCLPAGEGRQEIRREPMTGQWKRKAGESFRDEYRDRETGAMAMEPIGEEEEPEAQSRKP